MAQNSYDEGDYDSSNEYAAEAVRYAQLSDEYAVLQLKIKETNDAILAAKKRIDWAAGSGAGKAYPAEFAEAQGFYSASLAARRAEEWDIAIEAANNVVNVLAYVEAPDDKALPAQYTVRTWVSVRDCFWNIAGRSWVYNDPLKWKILYEANKSKLEDSENPDLIHPGMIIDIPRIDNESRSGMWDANKTYNR
jgi:nucleoid-associated protein YgaU